MTDNIYGYHGRLTADVLKVIARRWEYLMSGEIEEVSADGFKQWDLTRTNFNQQVVSPINGPLPAVITKDSLIYKQVFTRDMSADHCREFDGIVQEVRAAHLHDIDIMRDAGYVGGANKVKGRKLWHDLEQAKLAVTEPGRGKWPRVSWLLQGHFERTGDELKFDADGLYIANTYQRPIIHQRAVAPETATPTS